MTETRYRPDGPTNPTDLKILMGSGPEPRFDPVMTDFLREGHHDLTRTREQGGLLSFASLGLNNPWVYRLEFGTRGFVRSADGEITTIDRHVVALRFLPDYLRNADRFAMLRLIEPGSDAFHPNISAQGAICIEIYPGESLIEICRSLHDLFRWRLRQYDERDALNPIACGWGRDNVEHPIDDRPLFGRRASIDWQPTANPSGC